MIVSEYSDFLNESKFDSILNESVIYLSPTFNRVLTKIDNKIAKDLLAIDTTEIKPDITFVNIEARAVDGYITFITMANAWGKIKTKSPQVEYITGTEHNAKDRSDVAKEIFKQDHANVYSQSRNPLKIGKFVNKILPGKYNASEIEKFTNEFKAMIENTGEKFSIVEGDDIAYWYKGKTYASGGGNLNGSCMRNRDASVFKIYTHNPQVCKMLILVEDDKLLGRAIIWKVDSSGDKDFEYFMDRVYTTKDSNVIKFKVYAKEQGWAHKTHNNYTTYGNITYKGEEYVDSIVVQLGKLTKEGYYYNNYPYMDTFRRYDPETGKLYNDAIDENDGEYILADTSGGFEEVGSGVYSDWHGCNINEDDAVYSDWADSYLRSDESVYVDGEYFPEDCDALVYSDYEDEHLFRDNANWTDVYDSYIHSDSCITLITDVDSSGDITIGDDYYHENDSDILKLHRFRRGQTSELYSNRKWYKVLSEINGDWKYHNTLKALFTTNFKDEIILKEFRQKVYKVIYRGPIEGVEDVYLSEGDASLLGEEIEKSSRLVDKFDYHDGLDKVLILKLYAKLNSLIEKEKKDNGVINNLKLINYIERLSELENGLFVNISDYDDDSLKDEDDK